MPHVPLTIKGSEKITVLAENETTFAFFIVKGVAEVSRLSRGRSCCGATRRHTRGESISGAIVRGMASGGQSDATPSEITFLPNIGGAGVTGGSDGGVAVPVQETASKAPRCRPIILGKGQVWAIRRGLVSSYFAFPCALYRPHCGKGAEAIPFSRGRKGQGTFLSGHRAGHSSKILDERQNDISHAAITGAVLLKGYKGLARLPSADST